MRRATGGSWSRSRGRPRPWAPTGSSWKWPRIPRPRCATARNSSTGRSSPTSRRPSPTTPGWPGSGWADAMAEGWSSLFWTAFKRSQNPMGLLDERRRYVEVNGALLKLLGRTRDEVVDHHTWEFVESGPKYNQREWLAAVHKSDFTGDGIVVTGDGSRMAVQYAAHVETVTGRRLILLVVLSYARGRHVRRERGKPNGGGLSRRER